MMPIDVNLQEFREADTQSSFERAAKRQKTEETVKENIEQAQKKQKERYDLKHGAASCFGVGSVVLKKDFTRKKRKGGKLDFRWQGPYVISASLGKGLFKLKELDGDKVSCVLHAMCILILSPYTELFIACIFVSLPYPYEHSHVTQFPVSLYLHVCIQVVQRVNGFHLKRYFQSNATYVVPESDRPPEEHSRGSECVKP